MDPVQIRIDAEVADAIRKVLKLRDTWIDGKENYKKALAEMQAVTNKFTGDKLTRSASQYLAIIEKLGGVTALTAKEQQAVNKVLTEASEKYTRLGREVPEAMQKIIFATSQAAAKSKAELDKATAQISGQNIVEQANRYVQAITKVQDVNRLTEATQAKVNKTLVEAAEVYKRMGVQVPPQMEAILNATKKVKPAADELKKLRDALSGEGNLRTANQYLKVITDLGGVSKLTAEDQKKLLTSLNQMEARFAALGKNVPPEIKKIHDELKRLAPATDEVKKLQDRLSGREIIRDANNYVQAIGGIRNVTRLTANEQRALNTTLTEALAKYKALGVQAPKDLVNLFNATKSVGTETKNIFATTWADIAKGSFVGNIAANTLAAAWRGVRDMISGAGTALLEFVERGSQVDRVASAFEKLIPANKNIVASARDVTRVTEEMLEAGKRGTLGMATNFEIMKAANQAVLFGLPLTSKEFETLSRAAVTLGRAMDLGPGKALNDLIVALGRSSPRILDNLGIIVKLTEANQKYADRIGKNRLELTAEEKTIAFYTESMRKMGVKVEEIGEIKLNAADKAETWRAKLVDIRDEFGRIVAQSPILNRAIDGIGNAIFSAFGPNKQAQIKMVQLLTNTTVIAMAKGFELALVGAISLTTGIGTLIATILQWKLQTVASTEGALFAAVKAANALRPILGVVSDTVAANAVKALVELRQLAGTSEDIARQQAEVIKNTATAMVTMDRMRANTNRLIGELETLAKIDPFVTLKKSAENLPAIVNNDAANAESDSGGALTKAQIAQLKRNETFNAQWDKQQEKFREQYKEFVDWYEVAVARWTFATKKHDEAASKLLSDQNTQRVIDQFKKNVVALRELDSTLLRGTIPFHEMLQKVWGISKDPGEDPKKWLNADLIKQFVKASADGLGKIAQAFAQLQEASGNSIDGIVKDIGEFINILNVAAQSASGLRDGWDQMIGGIAKLKSGFKDLKEQGIAEVTSGLMGMTAAGISAAAGFMKATDVAGRGNRALRGAAAGAQIGMVAGPYGALAGAVIGAIVGALRNPMWEQSMKRVGRDLGVQISEGLARQIEKDAKEKFDKDLFTAETFNLSKIIQEAGGIKDSNFDKMLDRLNGVFALIDRGRLTTDEARKVLDENFGLFAAHLEKTGKLASQQMIEMIELNRRFRTESVEIRNFVLKTANDLGGALSRMANDTSERYKGLGEELEEAKNNLKDIQEEIAEARRKDPGAALSDELIKRENEAIQKLTDITNKQQRARGESQAEFERLGRLTLTAYSAMVKEGLTAEEIAERLGPAWGRLLDMQKNLGLETSNVLLKEQLQLENARRLNPTIFDGAAAINQAAIAYHNLGQMNQETFSDLEDQMQTYFTRLQSTGITQKQVLEENLPFLRIAIELERKKKVTLDETTKSYIQQAEELGLLKNQAKTDQQVMKDGFDSIAIGLGAVVEALGGQVPAALRKMIDAANLAAGEVDESIGDDVKEGVDKTGDSVLVLVDNLGLVGKMAQDSARLAVDGLGQIAEAAAQAAFHTTGIAEGHSPGGFRGIIQRAYEAKNAVIDFVNTSDPRLRDLYDTINRTNPGFNTIPGGPAGPEANRIRFDDGQFEFLVRTITELSKKPNYVIHPGAIQNNLSAYSIADKESIERTMARAVLNKIWADPDMRSDLGVIAKANR